MFQRKYNIADKSYLSPESKFLMLYIVFKLPWLYIEDSEMTLQF